MMMKIKKIWEDFLLKLKMMDILLKVLSLFVVILCYLWVFVWKILCKNYCIDENYWILFELMIYGWLESEMKKML